LNNLNRGGVVITKNVGLISTPNPRNIDQKDQTPTTYCNKTASSLIKINIRVNAE